MAAIVLLKGHFNGHGSAHKHCAVRRNGALLIGHRFPIFPRRLNGDAGVGVILVSRGLRSLIILLRFFMGYCDGKLRRVGKYADPVQGREIRLRRWLGYVSVTSTFLEAWMLVLSVDSPLADLSCSRSQRRI